MAESDLDAISHLCRKCGLCCNGALFENVQLQPGDDRRRLAELGFELWRKGRKRCFAQPCHALDGTICRVYGARPNRCRAFICRLLKRVRDGEIQVSTALRTIRQARRLQREVEKLGMNLGASDPHLPLMERYAQAISQPIDLTSGSNEKNQHGKLLAAMNRLMIFLSQKFRL